MPLRFERYDAVPEDDARILFGRDDDIWGMEGLGIVCRDAEVRFVAYDDSGPVSHATLLSHKVSIEGRQLMIAGLAGVVTVPAATGSGYATAVVEVSMEYAREELSSDFGFLFCHDNLIPFYTEVRLAVYCRSRRDRSTLRQDLLSRELYGHISQGQ